MGRAHVLVVGGGLIGLSSAAALLRDGHRVTVIERDHLGAGAATGNAGELTPQMVAPLASARTAGDIVRGVFTRSSYLSIAPVQLPRLLRFGIGFLRASSATRFARGEAALAQFSAGIMPALERLRGEGVEVSGGGEGFLLTGSDESELRAAHAGFARRAALGWGTAPGPLLRGEQLRAREATLAAEVRGAFELPGEFSLDPVRFVAGLIRHLVESGAEILEGVTAERVAPGATGTDGVTVVGRDASGEPRRFTGDRAVVAAGAWSSPLLRASGIRAAPVVSGKGYSFTVPVARMPRTVVHSVDRHCVLTPMRGRLRVAGMMEFDAVPERAHPDRFELLARSAARVFDGGEWGDRSDEWVGARPMTPDGLPLLGPVAEIPGVIVATGHNMHGLSLGPATGEVVADLVAGRTPGVNGAPLDLTRFAVARPV
ncbi:NAD(P)/FAD-dependent oxidoreductase [Leucobacter luti]|uniref:D-amino-acid dehydrogenase n=1 Tax=Leucobacter luti TaxID=340320 RepID=A0A4Q7U4U4_9MICO|nr:FAD-dependent oxidoreductase [Leucobacter luti]MBL3701062.1 FAD-dependent oxidoreductase [Leucobacter luti]RZT68716.1 D-amino-acid dehydrogenase [Leucobacter luti]